MRAAYRTAVGQGWVKREEFWRLHPTEFWWLVDAHTPVKKYGQMTEPEVDRLYWLMKAQDRMDQARARVERRRAGQVGAMGVSYG